MDKWEIFSGIFRVTATNEPNKCIIYLPGKEEFSDFIRIDSLNFDIKNEVFEKVKEIFKIENNQIKDIEKDDFDNSRTSFRGRNKNSSTSEKTRIVIFDDSVEIGSYTGKFYDYYVLRRNNE
ncbi:hypothetical protein R84B8_00571 [Treponema sp. R8-4-B8]